MLNIKTERVAESRVESESVHVYVRTHRLSASEERELKLLFGEHATKQEIASNTRRRSRTR
jgi:hypothetical protein